jgi:hypothetical protein
MRALIIPAIFMSSLAWAQSTPVTEQSGPPVARSQQPSEPVVETAVAPVVDSAALAALETARAQLAAANAASTNGDTAEASKLWRSVLSSAPLGRDGDLLVAEATRRLGFLAFEARDPRSAELWLRGEATLSRRLYRQGALPARRYAEAINRLASAVGANGRSEESAALLILAQDIKSRAQAAVSAAVMGREGVDLAAQQAVRVTASEASCATDDEPNLARRMTCEEEAQVSNDALIAMSQRVKADAPPPEPIKSEKGKGKG